MKVQRIISATVIAIALVFACAAVADDAPITNITVETLHERMQAKADKLMLVDVREQSEWDEGHIQGARFAPLGTVEENLKNVPKNREIALICHSGRRSSAAYRRLAALGYTNLKNVDGGMMAWMTAGYPTVK